MTISQMVQQHLLAIDLIVLYVYEMFQQPQILVQQ